MAPCKDYQAEAAAFFRSIGLDAETDTRLDGVRSSHDIDVMVRSQHAGFDREDTAGDADRLYDRLTAHFGEHMAIRDIDNIEPGSNFGGTHRGRQRRLSTAARLIGRDWPDTKEPDGRRRLDNPADWAPLELTAALRRGTPVVPVLVTMPRPEELPAPLRELGHPNALQLSDDSWNYDFRRLVEVVEGTVGRSNSPSAQTPGPLPPVDGGQGCGDPPTPASPGPPSTPPRPASWAWWPLPILLPIVEAPFAWSATPDPAQARKLLIGGPAIGIIIFLLSYIG